MTVRRINLALDQASMLGRGIVRGIAAYAQGREDWSFQPIDYAYRLLGLDYGPGSAEGIIGRADAKITDQWTGEARQYLVNVSRAFGVPGAANVTVDDAAIGRMGADYLRGKGLQDFAYFGPADSGERAGAFAEAVQQAGHTVRHIDSTSGQAAIETVLMRLPRPTGVLAFNDVEAQLLIRIAHDVRIPIPQDLAVVGVDNDPFASIFSPVPVTSIANDFEKIGYEAAAALDRVFQGQGPPESPIRIPPTELIERQSSDFPGDSDELAVRAARMIRQRACAGLTVNEIAEALPVTYQTLDRRFQRTFGKTMYEQITEIRMTEAARLLVTTRMPLWSICGRIGLSNTNYFSTVFRKHMGMPPGRYRREHRSTEGEAS